MTIAQILTWAASLLKSAGDNTARLDSLVLLEHVVRKPREWLLARPDTSLSQRQAFKYRSLVKKRSQHLPVAYLTGYKEFYGLNFKINDRVLTPRPESEKMVDYAIGYTPKGANLLDMGTGSGCLAVAIAKHRTDLKIIASDISKAALKLALQNARDNEVKLKLVSSDLFKNLPKTQFATIVANLPYVRDDLVLNDAARHEPKLAIRGGRDGLKHYRHFFAEAKNYLTVNGTVIIESLPDQQPPLLRLAKAQGFQLLDQAQLVTAFRAV